MKKYSNILNKFKRKNLFIILTMFFVLVSSIQFTNSLVFSVKADDDTIIWDTIINISDQTGLKRVLTIGEANNASNSKDFFDRPSPPIAPINPNIQSWIKTELEIPYNRLMMEYKNPSTKNAQNPSPCIAPGVRILY